MRSFKSFVKEEKPGLYANIHAKRARIKAGSGEKMRKPGSEGAPTKQDWKDAAKTAKEEVEIDELNQMTLSRYAAKARAQSMDKNNPKRYKRGSGAAQAYDKLNRGDYSEEVEIEEAVSVKKQNYSWGKMVTVHHGSDTSYPLHPEHQAKIKSLKDGEKTSFKDETKRTVTAHREGDKVHLSGAGSSKKTTVAHSHFAEEVELGEGKYGAFRLGPGVGRFSSRGRAQHQGLEDPRTGLPLGFSPPPKKDEPEKSNTVKKTQKEEKEKDDLPFTPDKPKSPSAKPGKYGIGYSTVKHLARMALQKQMQKKQQAK